jgi:hypothetical protein
MGVYHFMGLGRSVGVVSSAVSYIAARFQRNNADDREFFASSGEVNQTAQRGDAQALVLFTTPEVREGRANGLCFEYVANVIGQKQGRAAKDEPMPQALKNLMTDELRLLAGGRGEIDVYWCDFNRNDATETFERVSRVMAAAKPRGELGKEVWINLTGGTNVLNLSLQLAASLSGASARLYYLLADDIKLARSSLPVGKIGTDEDRFWVELPLIYLAFDSAHRAALEELELIGAPISESDLLSRLKGRSPDFHNLDWQSFRRLFLVPLYAQQLARWQGDRLQTGARWQTFKRYYDVMNRILEGQAETLTQLAASEDWFHHTVFDLRGH